MSEMDSKPAEASSAERPWEALFLEHLDAVERHAEHVARRSGYRPHEIEDFVSSVRLKLVDDDYAVLRKHRGESSLLGFLRMVVSNHLRDERNRLLGKYRPSAAAKRLGPDVIQLDRYVRRDGFEVETAIRMVRERYPEGRSVDELRRLAEELPEHVSRRFVPEEAIENRGEAGDAEEKAREEEKERLHERVQDGLVRALDEFPDQDLLILRLIFREGLPISKVARVLKLQQRSLYTRRDRCLASLRESLEAAGLTVEEVRDILGWDLEIPWSPPPEDGGDEGNSPRRPSQ